MPNAEGRARILMGKVKRERAVHVFDELLHSIETNASKPDSVADGGVDGRPCKAKSVSE